MLWHGSEGVLLQEGIMSETDIQWIRESLTRIEGKVDGLQKDHATLSTSLGRLQGAFYVVAVPMVAGITKYLFFSPAGPTP